MCSRGQGGATILFIMTSIKTSAILVAVVVAAILSPSLHPINAQEHHEHHSAYADQPSSGIAGLSPDEVRQLENGEGMGLARPAELNHYPGPKHVLEAADELDLTAEQRAAATAIFDRMKKNARSIGAEIIEKEAVLSRRFEHQHIDEESLRKLTSEIGQLRADLRYTHLEAHLEMVKIMSKAQIEKYDALRGY